MTQQITFNRKWGLVILLDIQQTHDRERSYKLGT